MVKLNQPYGPLAKTLLEKQVYPDAALTTYDDSAWTMGLATDVDVRTIEDKAILDAPAALLTADVVTAGHVAGSAAGSSGVFAVKHNGSLNLVTLRYRLKDVPVRAVQASFKAGDEDYPVGSLLVPASDRAQREIEALGLVAAALPEAPDVATVAADFPRLAIFTTWRQEYRLRVAEAVEATALQEERSVQEFRVLHGNRRRARRDGPRGRRGVSEVRR